MLYDVKFTCFRGLYSRVTYLPLGIFIGFVFLFEIVYICFIDLSSSGGFDSSFVDYNQSWLSNITVQSNMQLIANVLYNQYPMFVIVAALILLLAMLGSIILTVGISNTILKYKIIMQKHEEVIRV